MVKQFDYDLPFLPIYFNILLDIYHILQKRGISYFNCDDVGIYYNLSATFKQGLQNCGFVAAAAIAVLLVLISLTSL